MGQTGRRKYPIGMQTFERIREEGYVYIDKTALIYDLVTSAETFRKESACNNIGSVFFGKEGSVRRTGDCRT